MNISDYYQSLLDRRSDIMRKCIDDNEVFPLHVGSHNFIKDIDRMASMILGPEKVVFLQASREYQYALENIITGKYRQSFASLRLSFELFMASVHFSSNELRLRLWLAGQEDLVWSAIIDENKGIFSHNFCRAFNPDLGIYRSQYMNLASTVYRECSEYVHGNPATHEDISMVINYDPKKILDFHDKVSTVRLCVIFSFAMRYLPRIKSDHKVAVEEMILESFGNIPEIRAEFGAVK